MPYGHGVSSIIDLKSYFLRIIYSMRYLRQRVSICPLINRDTLQVKCGQIHGAGFWDKIKAFGRKLIKPIVGIVKDKFIPKLKGKAKDLATAGISRVASEARKKLPKYSGITNLAESMAKSKVDAVIDKAVNRGTDILDATANKYGGRLGTRRRKTKAKPKKQTSRRGKKPLDAWIASL